MRRVGIAASKIARGNLFLYNSFVVIISFLFSLFIFVLAGSVVVFALVIIAYVSNEVMAYDFEKSFSWIVKVSMVSLAICTLFFNLLIISKNVKLGRRRR